MGGGSFGGPVLGSGILSLTTDFGLQDGYVGTMKGVALGVDPSIRVVDLVHTVRPQSVLEGAFHLRAAWGHFPPGTVHLAVVDPGVGTERRSLVAVCRGQIFVAPDNGLLPAVFSGYGACGAVEYGVLDSERFRVEGGSRTFHGRDLYAPAAAQLASAHVAPRESISAVVDADAVVTIPWPEPDLEGDRADGCVLHRDRFGNIISNLDIRHPGVEELWKRATAVEIDGLLLPIVGTYGEGRPGQLVALLDSFGLIEVAEVDGDASARLGVDRGDPIALIAER